MWWTHLEKYPKTLHRTRSTPSGRPRTFTTALKTVKHQYPVRKENFRSKSIDNLRYINSNPTFLRSEQGAAGGSEFPAHPAMGFIQPPGGYPSDPTNNLDQGPSNLPMNNFSDFNLPSVPQGGFNPADLPSVPGMNFPSSPSNFPSMPAANPSLPIPQTPPAPTPQPQSRAAVC